MGRGGKDLYLPGSLGNRLRRNFSENTRNFILMSCGDKFYMELNGIVRS